jgi:hypothetical protein
MEINKKYEKDENDENDKNDDKMNVTQYKKENNEGIKESVYRFFTNFKFFLKKNIIELIIVFVLIFSIIKLKSCNTKRKPYQTGGDDNVQPKQPSETSIKTKQMVNQIGEKIRGNQTVQGLLTTVSSVIRGAYMFGVVILTLAVAPALPIFGVMFIIFIILRNRIASLKAL